MRKNTVEDKDGTLCYLRHYDDWLDFLSTAERVARDHNGGIINGLGCASMRGGGREWAGTDSLEEALSLARYGWPEGRALIRDGLERMHINRLVPETRRIIRTIDTSGDEPDIDLYLAGEPEHMVTLEDPVNPAQGKVVRFVFDCTWVCTTPTDAIIRRGIALYLVFETVRLLGYTVEVRIAESCLCLQYRGRYELHIPILRAGDPINLDTLAFVFIHPSVLRRLMFASEELETTDIRMAFGFHNWNGYGRCSTPRHIGERDMLIQWTDGLVSSDAEIVPFARSVLERIGIIPTKNSS